MKSWLKKQFTLNTDNLKAIGLGFLWAMLGASVAGIIGFPAPAVGIVVWVYASYKYQRKFAKRNEQKSQK